MSAPASPQSAASLPLPRRVNLPDALQYVGHCLELLVGQSLNRRDLVRIGALTPDVAHHILLARWQAEAFKVSGDVDRGSTAACLPDNRLSEVGSRSLPGNALGSDLFCCS